MVGIIPARAGFTNLPTFSVLNNGDHPRSRGVYRMSRKTVPACDGSSPLARGLPRVLLGQLRQSRIIPARAGFTHSEIFHHEVPRDHPRSRGVYEYADEISEPTSGSSPLARGLRRPAHSLRMAPWIIPARAGFTQEESVEFAYDQDHPRSRGVY